MDDERAKETIDRSDRIVEDDERSGDQDAVEEDA